MSFPSQSTLLVRMNYLADITQLKFSKSFDSVVSSGTSRTECPSCKRLRKYYCYDCVVPLCHEPPKPTQPLPVQFHIIRHNSEKPSKSSIIPLKLTYPDDVFLYTFRLIDRYDEHSEGELIPNLPDDIDWDRTALLFPEKGVSKSVSEMDPGLFNTNGALAGAATSSATITRVIVIDSTWGTAMQVIKRTPGLEKVKYRIQLSSQNKTIFWRHQTIDRSCLATCEAIYVLLREIWDAKDSKEPYDNRYDDVMFYYVFVHSLINDHYASTKRHKGWLPEYALTEGQ
jgi:DTW domain-containing protein YfiP